MEKAIDRIVKISCRTVKNKLTEKMVSLRKFNPMKKLQLAFLLLIMGWTVSAQDTFSIIAVDPDTRWVGSAGATCVYGAGANWDAWITSMIPGKGGINSQAYICVPNVNLANGMEQMELGLSPEEIIDWLLNNDACSSQNFNPEYRQYGVVDLDEMGNPRAAGWTGSLADDYKEDRQGPNYSVQGNILLNQSIIDNMENNFVNTPGTLADKLMSALQGANVPGADSRCLTNGDGTSSAVAYLVVYQPDDEPGDPWLRIVVPFQGSGVEPIDVLQILYDQFLSNQDNKLAGKVVLYPNPVHEVLHLNVHPSITGKSYTIYNLAGKKINASNITSENLEINTSAFSSGIYFMTLEAAEGEITLRFVKH